MIKIKLLGITFLANDLHSVPKHCSSGFPSSLTQTVVDSGENNESLVSLLKFQN
jgi:hypothetical protein